MPFSNNTIVEHRQESCEEFSIAKGLHSRERQTLAVKVLGKSEPISELAQNSGVSRKFLYKQAHKAQKALDEAFCSKADDTKVLFYLPITKEWLRQFVLVLILFCHASFRGIMQASETLLDTHLSLGTIHNIVRDTVNKARHLQSNEDLSAIKAGSHDEIFQNRKPVLVGIDVNSTYCYLLTLEESRDADTWGYHLLDLQEKGLTPTFTVADGGKGLRAGQARAWPGIPCHSDIFHALRDLGQLVSYLENRAITATSIREKMERKMTRAKKSGQGNKLSKKLALARIAETNAIDIATDIAILSEWMHKDILSVVGPELEIRRELFDFVVDELKVREHLVPHRIKPVRKTLENQREDLLAFAAEIDTSLDALAGEYGVPLKRVRDVFHLQGIPETNNQRWLLAENLHKQLGSLFYSIQEEVKDIISQTVRASSIVENLNSRLRNYFFLRRQLGPEYLELLRFFLNHQRFLRSHHPERIGHSPAELLTGCNHPHWLEMMGFQLFKQSA